MKQISLNLRVNEHEPRSFLYSCDALQRKCKYTIECQTLMNN